MPIYIKPWNGDLQPAKLRARPHRFKINVSLSKKLIGAHCVNPGRGEGPIEAWSGVNQKFSGWDHWNSEKDIH